MPSVIFSDYRDEHKLTKYPFVDTATLVSTKNEITLPQDIFCDASIYIPGAIAPVYIQKLSITSIKITLTVSDYAKQNTAIGEIVPRSNSIELYNSSEQQVGILVASNDLTYFTSLPKGEYEFTASSTSFVPRCIIPLKDIGVTSMGVYADKQVYGDIWLIGKDGIIIRYVDDAIRIDIVGDPLFKRVDPTFEVPTFIKTINGVSSDEYGNFKITVSPEDDILRIDNSSDGITIYAAGV